MKFAFYTLGCKTNQYETSALEHMCVSDGHTVVSFEESADVYVINTCAVTSMGCRKSRAVIHQARRRNPDGVISVCGCYSQIKPEEVLESGADLVFGTAERGKIIERSAEYSLERKGIKNLVKPVPKAFETLKGNLSERTRAYLKIEDGCDNFCTYCVIPYARGRVRSPSREFVLSELDGLDRQGYNEIVITGIEISSYGKDTGDTLDGLIEAMCVSKPNIRFRLGSLEPRTITKDFCARLCKYDNLCNHFHLSLQSGCDETLSRMKRRYNTDRFYESVQLLRKYFKDCAVTTDLITGFPGETEEEFKQTLEFIKKCRFAAMHIFPYSVREGTVAAKMENQISADIKDRRASEASEAAEEMKTEFLKSMIGKKLEVLFESEENGKQYGHSKNYCLIRTESEEPLRNKVKTVLITEENNGILDGIIENNVY